MASLNVAGSSLRYKNLLVVIKQTAFEEYSQVKGTTEISPWHSWPIKIGKENSFPDFVSQKHLLWYLCMLVIAEITRPSTQGITMETLGTTLHGPQAMREWSFECLAPAPGQFQLRQSGRIGSTTFGRYWFDGCRRWRWYSFELGTFSRSRYNTTPWHQFGSQCVGGR